MTSRRTYSACDASDASCAIFLRLVNQWRLPGMDALNILGRLKEGGINLHMIDLGGVTGNGVSKLVFTILSAVAEAERDRTRERVAEVKRDQRQRGRVATGARATGGAEADAEAAGRG